VAYKAIDAEKANFPITMMCRCLGVSPSGYHAWRTRAPSDRAEHDERLRDKIKAVHHTSRGTYGTPRMRVELAAEGFEVSRKRVARLMAQEGIVGRELTAFKKTTESDHDDPIAVNVLGRDFETDAPDKAWVADITYIRTHAGWLYLAVVLDLYSRRVVGWSMAEHMRTELVLNALRIGVRVVSLRGSLSHQVHLPPCVSIRFE